MNPTLRFRSLAATVGLAATFLPLSASAATPTPQQILNQAIKNGALTANTPSAMDGTISVEGRAVQFKGNKELGHGAVNLRLQSRTLGATTAGQLPDGEGQLTLVNAHLIDNETGENHTVTQPVGVEWKLANQTFYFRVKDVPMDWLTDVPNEVKQYMNQWLRLAIPQDMWKNAGSNLMMPMTNTQEALAASLGAKFSSDLALQKRLQNMPVFLVTRVESRTVVNGKQMLRLRVKLNPALVTLVHNEQIKALRQQKMTRQELNDAIRNVNKSFSELRSVLNKLHMAMNVNATDNLVQRFEVGGTFTQPLQDCNWNTRLNRTVCNTTGRSTFKVAGGFSFMAAPTTPVVVPAASTDLMQLFTDYMRQSLGEPTVTTSASLPSTTGTN